MWELLQVLYLAIFLEQTNSTFTFIEGMAVLGWATRSNYALLNSIWRQLTVSDVTHGGTAISSSLLTLPKVTTENRERQWLDGDINGAGIKVKSHRRNLYGLKFHLEFVIAEIQSLRDTQYVPIIGVYLAAAPLLRRKSN